MGKPASSYVTDLSDTRLLAYVSKSVTQSAGTREMEAVHTEMNGSIERQLTSLYQDVSSAHTARRKLLPLVRADNEKHGEPISRPATRALCLLLADVAFGATHNDYKATTYYVKQIVKAALRSPQRWPTFADAWSTVLSACLARCTYADTSLVALRLWNQLLDHHLSKRGQEVDASKSDVLRKAIPAQANLFEGLALSQKSGRQLELGVRETQAVWRHHVKTLPTAYMDHLMGPGGTNGAHTLLAVLIRFYEGQLKEVYATRGVKAQFLELYLRDAINAKSRPSMLLLRSFQPLLATVTHQDMTSLLLPAIEKALKKSPASVLSAVVAFVGQVPLDFSDYTETVFLPPALRQLRSPEEELRMQATELLKALASRSSSGKIYCHMIAEVSQILLGKGGILAQWSQRQAVTTALRALASNSHNFPRSELWPAISVALDGLVTALGKEAHEGTRAEIVGGIGDWLRLAEGGEGPPKSAIEALKKGLSGAGPKEAAVPFLLAVRDALAGPAELKMALRELEELLWKIVKEASRRTGAANLESLIALHCLLDLAQGQVDPEVVKYLIEPTSWLYAPALFEAVNSPAQAPAALSLTQVILAGVRILGATEVLGPMPNFCADEALGIRNVRPASIALIEMLVHQDRQVQRETKAVIESVVAGDPVMSVSLLKAFWVKLDQVAKKIENVDRVSKASQKEEGENTTKQGTVYPPQRFASALRCIVPEGSPIACLPLCLVLVYHSLVSSSPKSAHMLWSRIRSCIVPAEAGSGLDDVSVDVSDEVLQAILSGVERHRKAGQQSLAALASSLGQEGRELLVNGIVPALLTTLQRPELLELRALDITIFWHPAGSVYQIGKVGTGIGGKGETKAAQARRARTGKRDQVYSAEDEKWEEEYKRKKAAQKAADSEVGPSAGELQLLAEEAEIREKVGALRKDALAVLGALEALSHLASDIAHAVTSEALQTLTPLIQQPLLDKEVYSTIRALSSCIEPNARPISWDLAAAVRLVLVEKNFRQLSRLSNVFVRCIDYLSGFCSEEYKERLSANTFCLLFCILRAVLLDEAPGPDHSDALAIVSAHANLAEIPETPLAGVGPSEVEVLRPLRRHMIEVTLYVLKHHPRLEPAPGAVLIHLVMGPPLSVGEWAFLLGDAGMLSDETTVRLEVLEALENMAKECGGNALGTRNPLVESRLWVLQHDEEIEVKEAAERVWQLRGRELSAVYAAPLLVLLRHPSSRVREAAAKALAAAVALLPDTATATLKRLLLLYDESQACEVEEDPRASAKLILRRPGEEEEELQKEGQAKEEGKANTRFGVGCSLEQLGRANALNPDGPDRPLDTIFSFLLDMGVADPADAVRQQMVAAGMALVDAYGATHAESLLPLCEAVLERPAVQGEDVRAFDFRREGTVVFMGSTAKHLDKTDTKVLFIIDRLVAALATPSAAVQKAVAVCMVPLMPCIKANAGDLGNRLLDSALKGETYGVRRGAAYGISALIKGLGIGSLKQHGIMAALENAVSSTLVNAKQGALFCFECLCDRLKILFEPYVIVILPLLLRCFSDPSDHVRDAASLAGKAVMANLSPHGVKLVMPTILRALEDSGWRSKTAALNLLGAMAYCAPKQLGNCLPQIVPRMTEAFGDTHPKVREAGKAALADIGKVIRNPEIRKLSPLLLSALIDPSKNTKDALEGLLSCEFMHSVDAPSLALLIPIVQRSLKDRGADLKRKASVITGNMSQMISEARDLVPYLPALLPGLKGALGDPIPDVRATAARALGSLMRGMGEESLFDLVPWLIDTLKGDLSTVERSGAAQGLAQVLVSLADDRVDAILSSLLALRGHPRYAVREGVLWLLSFLPSALASRFTPFLGESLPVIVAGLTDEVESVRDVAMRAGQVLVSTHGKHHADQLVPPLEAGLFDDSWRIRQSSVQLLGDLLYTIGGTKAVGLAMEEDEGMARGSSRAEVAISVVLGPQRRAKILASLYVIRSDISAVVRQSALQVWKTVVSNTPRVLREILPTLVELLIGALASYNIDKRTVAGRALGDIVRKLGDHVLPEVVPHLRHELSMGDENVRQGVCLGLAEILGCAQKKQIDDFASTLVQAILDALTDPASSVRREAGQAFLAFHRILGTEAIQKVVPPMLDKLEAEQGAAEEPKEQGRALLGVKELLKARPRELLHHLLPKLTRTPISVSHAQTLEVVAEVTGPTLHLHASTLIPLLVEQMIDCEALLETNERRLEALRSCTGTILISVESAGVQHLVIDLTKLIESPEAPYRRHAAWMIGHFATGSRVDIEPQAPILFKYLIPLMNDPDESVWAPTSTALRCLTERLGPEGALAHLDFIRNVTASVVSDARRRKGGVGDAAFTLPGLNVAGSLDAFMPVYTYGLLQGLPTRKELAASFMGELIEYTSPTTLRPYTAKIVGPLIRIVSDKSFPAEVKAALLQTMTLLLEKGGPALRGLAPQLQTTFTKALADVDARVRAKALLGLERLVPLSMRLDPLVSELLLKAVGAATGPQVQAAMCQALAGVLAAAGSKVSVPVLTKAADQFENLLGHSDPSIRSCAALSLGQVLTLLPKGAFEPAIRRGPLASRDASTTPEITQGRALTLSQVLCLGSPHCITLSDVILSTLKSDCTSQHAPVKEAGLSGLCNLLRYTQVHDSAQVSTIVQSCIPEIAAAMQGTTEEVQKRGLALLKEAAKVSPADVRPHLLQLIPLLRQVLEGSIAVKYHGERALLYAAEIHSRPETVKDFLMQASGEDAKWMMTYRRILSSKPAQSDDEGENLQSSRQ